MQLQSKAKNLPLKKVDLAKMLGISAGKLSYHLLNGDIPNGDIKRGMRHLYSQDFAKMIVKNWGVK